MCIVRYKHSAGKQKVMQLEKELSRLQATNLEQLQEQVRQKVDTLFFLFIGT